ncbi:HlyD family efflux transporter periplasmic adaptor subunit [Flammeovirga yaeyamensis]|uniref:HlyD family efflux transporter periplasmic adaptor subunit n=1 Tax=Flammeovirga yaeyamensis TaxID=367791 RepID=A0AAX1NBN6_9BACT|nr:HlyD family efflux transporter periplasmic adaptor subunit [Flammeovirga yaeyamensis]MBB3698909.1 HlyD family secretion protein [Flammeovirga yaeyamensis]NMF36344.1 HlyD family efflux transporter periplasmic adaptor subunit [Flammeovirga yaeyamensis]QWG03695.1 HlyD family efflux transporter periplasmic adaptor subunit [Flammeovirga yaeyamensis]
MDKVISKSTQKKAKQKKQIQYVAIIIGICAVAYFANSFLGKSIKRKDISIGVVTKGSISLTVNGSGKIEPVYQKAITSPFSTFIESIHSSIGEKVDENTSILQLNTTAEESTLSSLIDQANIKKAELEKEKLRLRKELYQLNKEVEINALQLKSREEALKGEMTLLEIGGSTEENVKQAKTLLEIEKLKQDQLQNDLKIKEKAIEQEIKTLSLSLGIQQKQIKEQRRKLDKAQAHAGIDGVITFLNDNVGASVAEGEILAKVANIEKLKIRGTVAEQNVGQISIGMEVNIKSSKHNYVGQLTSISPSSKNGMLTVFIDLPQQDHLDYLRPDMVVDINIIKEQKENTLKIKNRGAFEGKKVEELFVIKNGIAEKVAVNTGMRNSLWVEVTSNLQEGDSVIISPYEKFKNANQIQLQ